MDEETADETSEFKTEKTKTAEALPDEVVEDDPRTVLYIAEDQDEPEQVTIDRTSDFDYHSYPKVLNPVKRRGKGKRTVDMNIQVDLEPSVIKNTGFEIIQMVDVGTQVCEKDLLQRKSVSIMCDKY